MARWMMVLAGIGIAVLALAPQPAEARPCWGWRCQNVCGPNNCGPSRCARRLSDEGLFCGCSSVTDYSCAGGDCVEIHHCKIVGPLCTFGCDDIPPHHVEGLSVESFDPMRKAVETPNIELFTTVLENSMNGRRLVSQGLYGAISESIPGSTDERGEPRFYPAMEISGDVNADGEQADFTITIGETTVEGMIWDGGKRGFALVYEEGSPQPRHFDW